MKEGEEEFIKNERMVSEYGEDVVIMELDEKGKEDKKERKIEIWKREYKIMKEKVGLKKEEIILDKNIFEVEKGIEEKNN